MTSKNLFFKLMKEDFKIRIWSLAISILSFFFSLIVATAMLISYHRNMTYSYLIEETGEIVDDSYKLVERFNFYMNIKNPLFAFVFLCLSLIVAISGFTYLYSKKKVDMYHSLPVKREVLFAVKVINGILIVIVPFIICTIIASLMIAVNTSDGSVIIRSIGVALGWCVFFILNYSVVMLAIMLTGNMLIGILAFVFFSFYFPLTAFMLMGFQSTFFETYYYAGDILEKILPNTSSFVLMFNLVEIDTVKRIIISAVVSILLMILNLFLYKKRASETAGKSISFSIIKLPIKFMIVIFMSMLMYLMAYEMMMSSTIWGIFGAVIGGIITHCIMEIIYNQDFKKIFSKKIEMLICIVLALFFIASFQMDLFGYDRYVPKASDIKQVAVVSNFLESNTDQYHSEPKFSNGFYGNDNYTEDDYYYYDYAETRLLKNLNIENKDIAVKIAKQCVDSINNSSEREGTLGYVIISYTLKSGRVVQRKYNYFEFESAISELSAIYDDPVYKKSMYPILSEKSENILSIDFDGVGYDDKHIETKDTKLTKKLLEAYKKELSALKYETRLKSYPFASIRFNDAIMEKELNSDFVSDYAAVSEKKTDTAYVKERDDKGYYPVFPEFKETIAVLKEMGVDVIEKLPAKDVDRIEITYYNPENGAKNYDSYTESYDSYIAQKTFTDTADIEKILDSLVVCDSAYQESLNEDDNITAFIYMKDDKENAYGGYTSYRFKKGNVPDIVK